MKKVCLCVYECHPPWEMTNISLSNANCNKLAKARKMRKPPGTLSLKKFGLGNLWVEKVWTQNTCIPAIHFQQNKKTLSENTLSENTLLENTH